jgi:hypothetical protein
MMAYKYTEIRHIVGDSNTLLFEFQIEGNETHNKLKM